MKCTHLQLSRAGSVKSRRIYVTNKDNEYADKEPREDDGYQDNSPDDGRSRSREHAQRV